MTKAAVHFIHIVTDDSGGKLKHSQMEQELRRQRKFHRYTKKFSRVPVKCVTY